jgi:hypothetical protein
VLAGSVEAHVFCKFDVAAERVIIRRSQTRVRPIALIENHSKRVRPAIQYEAVPLNADGSQGSISDSLVDQLAAAAPQLHFHIDQVWGRWGPENCIAVVVDTGIGKRDPAVDLSCDHRIRIVGDELIPEAKLHGHS